jgi:hypothetical protein
VEAKELDKKAVPALLEIMLEDRLLAVFKVKKPP